MSNFFLLYVLQALQISSCLPLFHFVKIRFDFVNVNIIALKKIQYYDIILRYL